MSNEELAARIQAGDRAQLMELWFSVQRLVLKYAGRWAAACRGVEVEDLMQEGFAAMLRAVESFDCSAGAKFTTWLGLHLKGAFTEATGQRTQRQKQDPLYVAVSLDAPVYGGDEATHLGDLLSDPSAEAAMLAVEERDRSDRLRALVAELLSELPENQRKAVVGRYWLGQSVDPIAHAAALRQLRHPSRSKRLKPYL